MNRKNIDQELFEEIFTTIRQDEVKNVRNGQFDDKAMVTRLYNYVLKKARDEMEAKDEI